MRHELFELQHELGKRTLVRVSGFMPMDSPKASYCYRQVVSKPKQVRGSENNIQRKSPELRILQELGQFPMFASRIQKAQFGCKSPTTKGRTILLDMMKEKEELELEVPRIQKKLNSLIVSAREQVAQQRDRSTQEEAAAPLGPRTTLSNKTAVEVKYSLMF